MTRGKPDPKKKKKQRISIDSVIPRERADAAASRDLTPPAPRTVSAGLPAGLSGRLVLPRKVIPSDQPHPTDAHANLAQLGDKVALGASMIPGGQLPAGLWMMARGEAKGDPAEGVMGGLIALTHAPIKPGAALEWLRAGNRASSLRSGALEPVAAWSRPHATEFAKAYEALPAADPGAATAYRQMVKEVDDQFAQMERNGIKVEYTTEDPYKTSQAMIDDVQKNGRLKVFKSSDDFQHPFLSPAENDRFRAVHDYYGHFTKGNKFSGLGEENAFRNHSPMFSPEARRAMATETRGQNSWVNAGPNAHLPPSQRPFAEQKGALWPQELMGDYRPLGAPPVERRSMMSQFRRTLGEIIDPTIKADRRALVTDDLTGLENQRAFNAARESIDADPNMVWFSTDMQGLKAFNTQFGQEGGNALLRRQSDAAKAAIDGIPGARVFRNGGDEVVFALPRGFESVIEQRLNQAAVPVRSGGKLMHAKLVGSWGDTYAAADRGMQAAKAAAKEQSLPTPVLNALEGLQRQPPAAAASRPGSVGSLWDTIKGVAGNERGAARVAPEGRLPFTRAKLPDVGGDPTKVAPKAAALEDTPAKLKKRVDAARAFLQQPTEPWVPTPRGFVDRSLITPDVGPTPADAMPLHERTLPLTDRAAMGHFRGINNPTNVQLIADQIARGRMLGGETFYPSYGAVEADLAGRGMDPRRLLDATSAGSIRSSVPHELTNATVINWGLERGMFDAQSLAGMTREQLNELATQLRAAVRAEFPGTQGVPLMGTHLQTYGNLARDEVPSAFKVPTYKAQKGSSLNVEKGNVPGMVLDTHESIGQTLGSPFHRFFAGNKGFTGADYGVMEDVGRQVARGTGLSDRAAQASRWTGGGPLTGLRSPPGDYAQIYEDMLAWNADRQGLPAGRLADNIAKGQGILFPDYGKSALHPR